VTSGTTGPAVPHIGSLFDAGTAVGLSDRVLLERFLARQGAAAESAFAALVARHGPLVLRVCRDVLGDPHDAEDAFQAVFLVLARRAGSIRRETVGPWLYGVALRVARCSRRGAGRRREVERRGAAMADEARAGDPGWPDAARAVHEEVIRLPDKYR
jgi:RNA polymerase sigma-70 factor (ECF subfamily)